MQATDTYAGTLGARIIVADDKQVRALMSASWLKQMGWREVFVLDAGADPNTEKGNPAAPVLGMPPPDKAIEPKAAQALDGVTVIDLSTSPHYRRGHIPGAWFAIRSRLDRAFAKLKPGGPIILTSEDGVLASLAVADAQGLTSNPVHWLKGGNAAWRADGLPLSNEDRMADEAVDVWLKPYERKGDPKDAMNEYLSWEVDLLERIKQDGTTHFVAAK